MKEKEIRVLKVEPCKKPELVTLTNTLEDLQVAVSIGADYPDVYEDVIKGKITIIKHCDDGSTKIETPEQGAVFAVYLKTAGSYDNAKETERALLTCDEHGFAETDWLPYGVYVVEQIEGWEGKEMMPAFDVKVHADGEIYR